MAENTQQQTNAETERQIPRSGERTGRSQSTPATTGHTAMTRAGAPAPTLLREMLTSPWTMLRRMSEDLDRLTQDGWVPRIEIINRKDAVEVRAELPGVRPEDVNVQVSSGMLTISGERQQEEHEEREGFVRTEREYGAFSRMIPLPDGADENRVSAKFNNGMLQITVPVAAREKGKRVEVQS